MQTVFVSRGSYRRGKELAEKLAERLGCRCISREEVVEGATHHGIPVGKLEEAVVKRRPLTEPLSLLADRYRAYVMATLCERALEGDLVYHGRAGHLALPGVAHVLRVRALTDVEDRYEGVIARLNLSRDKAVAYVDGVDEDIRRWIRTLYDLDINDPALFNLTVNCSKLAVGNVAAGLVTMAQLPEFQATPASLHRLADVQLAARCRLALADDPRTRDLSAQVRADAGSVSVTYLPRQASLSEAIPAVLDGVEGLTELRRTVAASSILWVQERFEPDSETLAHLLDIAGRWEAAIDLVRLVPGEQPAVPDPVASAPRAMSLGADDGGILEDIADARTDDDDGGVKQTLHHLIRTGHGGSQCTVAGGQQSLIGSLCNVSNVSLVVVDNLFLDRGPALRKRLTRDLASQLADRLRVPVVGAEELKSQYLFGPKQWLQLVTTVGIAALLYLAVFSNQGAVLELLRAEDTTRRTLAVVLVAAMAPLVAYLWGTASHHLLRLVRFE